MIDIRHKADCCGCEACVQVCPKKCINFSRDGQGFLYPVVDRESCIDCGLCERVCPILNQVENTKFNESPLYAIKNRDDFIRKNSSSGGFFTSLANYVLEANGVVYGAAYDENFVLKHCRVRDKDNLHKLRGSKYLQSNICDTFSECRNDLNEGRLVLFTGTPCQISALRLFLGKEYQNLIRVEVVCHGVPSPMIFKTYLSEILPLGSIVKSIQFRDKKESWKKYHFTTKYDYCGEENVYSESVTESLYMKGFLSDMFIRPSCFKCQAKSFKSLPDFTIADFWGQEYTFRDFDTDTGVSAVFVHTDNAYVILSHLTDIIVEPRPFTDFIHYNPSLCNSAKLTYKNKRFWRNYVKSGKVSESVLIASKVPFYYRIIQKIINILK